MALLSKDVPARQPIECMRKRVCYFLMGQLISFMQVCKPLYFPMPHESTKYKVEVRIFRK